MKYECLILILISTMAVSVFCIAEEAAVKFPTKIVLTQQDFMEIREHQTLKGRRVGESCYEWTKEKSVWDDLQLFSGKKEDVLDWFINGKPGLPPLIEMKSQYMGFIRGFQYDMLISELLQSGDIDVIRCVLQYTGRYMGSYIDLDWQNILSDRRLSIDERMDAFIRVQSWPIATPSEVIFFREFGDKLTSNDIVRLSHNHIFPWNEFRTSSYNPPFISHKRANKLFFPLLEVDFRTLTRPRECVNQ